MKTRSKGKAIIGIAIAAVMIASVMVPMVSAGKGYSPWPGTETDDTITLIKGTKDLDIRAWTDIIKVTNTTDSKKRSITIIGAKGTTIEGETHMIPDVTGFDVSTGWSTGLYAINKVAAVKTIFVEKPSISTSIKLSKDSTDVTGMSVVSEEKVNIVVTTNFGYVLGNDKDTATIKLKVVYPDGTVHTVDDADTPNSFTDENVKADKVTFTEIQFDKEGEYTITAQTPSPGVTENSKLTISATPVTITVRTEVVDISVETSSVPESDDVIVEVTGKAKENYYLETTGGKFKKGVKDVTVTADDQATVKTGSDGVVSTVIDTTSEDTGSYTVSLYESEQDRIDGKEKDKIDFRIVSIAVEVETDRTTYVVGEDIKVSGVASAGDFAIIAIDKEQVKKATIKADGTFSYTWYDSAQKAPGTYKIEVWVMPVTVPGPDNRYAEPGRGKSTSDLPAPDASTSILLGTGDLSAETSTAVVALGDDFKVTGISRGPDTVNILVIAPRGTGGTKIDDADADSTRENHVYHSTVSVNTIDRTFSKKIEVDKDADTGSYLVVVLSPGIDEKYTGFDPAVDCRNFFDTWVTTYNVNVAAKTQEQILEMLIDATVGKTYTDDLMWTGYVKAETAYVRLDSIASVRAGEPLVVTGTSNRKDGYLITVEATGPETLVPQTVKVESGTFTTTFGTTDAIGGEYTVKADDGDGHTDDVEVVITGKGVEIAKEIKEAVKVAEEKIEEILATPKPTPKPTPTPEPTPKPPGFEAIFAIAGLLAVAYLVHRRKN